jgi:hypothetical protein
VNFAAFTFLGSAQPRGALRWYLAFLFLLCCAISPVRAAALGSGARPIQGAIGCDAATRNGVVAPSQAISFHAATRHPETLRSTQHSAPRSASDVKHLLPPSGSFGVMLAGAVRGSGAGILFISPTTKDEVRRLPDEGEADKGSATMAVSVASRNQERSRV